MTVHKSLEIDDQITSKIQKEEQVREQQTKKICPLPQYADQRQNHND